MSRALLAASLACLAAACSELLKEPDDAVSLLAPREAPHATHAHGPFVRVGVMMDAHAPDAIELRTSVDGVTWTDWQRLTVVFAEGEAFAGHLDAPPGSSRFEVRFTDASRPPRWLLVEDIEALGEPSAPLEAEPPAPPPTTGVGTRTDALAPFPTILPRSAWGARAPTCRSLTNPYRLVVHHTASPTNDTLSPEARLRQTQAYHMDSRGYCDIAYNFLMSRDARVWEGRGDGVLGGHTLNQNTGNMALCLIGTYTTDRLTAAQACALSGWMAWQSSRHGIALTRTNIKGHREWGSTECPGNTVFAQLDALVAQAATTCPGLEPPRPDWGAEFVAQSFPAAHVMAVTLEEGQALDGWFELRNIGTRTWTTAATRLAPTPREQASPLADPSWLAPTRVGGVAADTAPGQVGRFPVRLRANAVGSYSQTFGLLHENVAWFADQGGPADTFVTVRVEVVPRATPDAGAPTVDAGLPVDAPDAGPAPGALAALPGGTASLAAADGGGCGCHTLDGSALAGLVVLLGARRRRGHRRAS